MSEYIDSVRLNGVTIPLRDSGARELIAQINREAGGEPGGCGAVTVNFGIVSSLPVTKNVPSARSDMTVVAHEFSDPEAFTGDLTVTVNDGSVTLSGVIRGSSTVKLTLVSADPISAY